MGTSNPTREAIGYGKVLPDLLGEADARSVAKKKEGTQTQTNGKISQDVTVTPAGHWNMNCWT